MKIILNSEEGVLTVTNATGEESSLPLYSNEAFELLSREWLRIGWSLKYSYSFTWLGRPMIQLPEDVLRIQEVIFCIRPDVIVETGIAHGGSLVFYASLCRLLGQGHVIGIDIEIRPENRTALEQHELSSLLTLINGSSTDPEIVEQVKSLISPDEKVLVILDSNHSKQHVLHELEAYCGIVTPGSYIIATDGIMRDLHDVPGGSGEWSWNNPTAAAADFLVAHPEFVQEEPQGLFRESSLRAAVTYWPGAWLKRVK